MYSAVVTGKYAPLWSKYRPAILKLLIDSASEPQTYKLMSHEIKSMDEKKKGSFSFNLHIAERKAVNNIKDSEIAQDLLNMLQQSKKGSELIQANRFEISMDKHFQLQVTQIKAEQ
ncbi:MAG: hypothetical protein O9340_15965 [Cyclobacteriaceae bacterium]|jgi:hypothetical protein|nr:hypothetical protein [Cyclobacteriaceae bacterium]